MPMQKGKGEKTVRIMYHGLSAARYDALYRVCLLVEKHRLINLFVSYKEISSIYFMGMNETVFAGGSEPFSAKLRFTTKEQILLLSCFQFMAYKNYSRMRICLNKLIENRKVRKLQQIVRLYKKMKKMGTKWIVQIWDSNKNIKAKATALAKWRRYVKYKEAEDFVRMQEISKREFENKIVEHRRTIIMTTEAESVKRKNRITEAENKKVRLGDLVNAFQESAEKSITESFLDLSRLAKEDNFQAFSAKIVDASINMYLNALEKLHKESSGVVEDGMASILSPAKNEQQALKSPPPLNLFGIAPQNQTDPAPPMPILLPLIPQNSLPLANQGSDGSPLPDLRALGKQMSDQVKSFNLRAMLSPTK